MIGRTRRRRLAGLFLGAVLAVGPVGCSPSGTGDAVRGVILINLSGMRADVLQSSGGVAPAAPFLAALAREGLSFERAFAVSSDPIAAEASLQSGLYPQEHRAAAPDMTLASEVPVLAERFAAFGYRTAGFTGGGYAGPDFGIDRGFDRFETLESVAEGSHPMFAAAMEHLEDLGDGHFFLYLHPDELQGASLAACKLDFPRLAVGFEELTPELLEESRRHYEDQVRRLDDGLEALVERIDALGLRDEVVLLVTADRAFELGEHGRVGHSQLYPESLRVPLVLLAPGLEVGGSRDLVQTVDVAASLYALAGVPSPPSSGRLVPGLPGAPGARTWGAAETRGRWAQTSLLLDAGDGLVQFVESRLRGEYDGTWVTREMAFDTGVTELEFAIVSYLVPRRIVVEVDGVRHGTIEAAPEWSDARIELPPGNGVRGAARRRVRLAAPDCASPADSSASVDRRCLSFKIEGLELSRSELFDLEADPGAERDLSFERPELFEELAGRFAAHRWLDVPPPEPTRPGEATMERILASGEFPEPPRP